MPRCPDGAQEERLREALGAMAREGLILIDDQPGPCVWMCVDVSCMLGMWPWLRSWSLAWRAQRPALSLLHVAAGTAATCSLRGAATCPPPAGVAPQPGAAAAAATPLAAGMAPQPAAPPRLYWCPAVGVMQAILRYREDARLEGVPMLRTADIAAVTLAGMGEERPPGAARGEDQIAAAVAGVSGLGLGDDVPQRLR